MDAVAVPVGVGVGFFRGGFGEEGEGSWGARGAGRGVRGGGSGGGGREVGFVVGFGGFFEGEFFSGGLWGGLASGLPGRDFLGCFGGGVLFWSGLPEGSFPGENLLGGSLRGSSRLYRCVFVGGSSTTCLGLFWTWVCGRCRHGLFGIAAPFRGVGGQSLFNADSGAGLDCHWSFCEVRNRNRIFEREHQVSDTWIFLVPTRRVLVSIGSIISIGMLSSALFQNASIYFELLAALFLMTAFGD